MSEASERRELEAWLREVLSHLAGPAQAIRLALIPVIAVVWLLSVWLDPAPWRSVLGLAALTGVATLALVSWWRWRAGLAGQATWAANAVLMIWIQLVVIALTGGLVSPLLPVMPVVALQMTLMFGTGREQAAVLGGQVAALVTFAACELSGLHLGLPGIAVPGTPQVLVTLFAMLLMLFVAALIGWRVRAVVAAMVSRVSAASAGEREAHAHHARELMVMSAEIAHELKNPLASIHGLGALLAKDLQGKDAERLAVLREEVTRMRETLERFLDFSRPLAPLVLEDVDLNALASDVAAMCEGLARARSATVRVEGSAEARGDRRKLRQVLVNLVQNALDAAPPGSAVDLVVAASPPSVEVRDRGPGVAPELRAQVFEPGVTDKPSGSGLGLTIARALVRQHGGELALLDRDGGGTVARVVLGGAAP